MENDSDDLIYDDSDPMSDDDLARNIDTGGGNYFEGDVSAGRDVVFGDRGPRALRVRLVG